MSNPIVRYIQKQLFGQKGVIANNKTVSFEAAKLAEKLSEFGVDPRLIKNEKQLEGIINQIKELQKKRMAESMEVISQDDPRFKGIMSKMTGSNVIKRDFGKPFKEEIEKMSGKPENKSGSLMSVPDKKGLAGMEYETDAAIKARLQKSNERSVQNLRMQMMDDKVANDMFQGGPSRDPKTDADMLAEFIAEDAGKIYDDLPTKERLKFYDRAYNAIVRYRKKDPEDMADGGRAGFKMGRRAFLKALGAGIGGAAALKTGIIGLGTKKAVTGAGEKIITAPVKGKPEWFDALVNKVIREGDDVSKNFATKEREIVHKLDIDNLDDVKVTQDLDEGLIRVEYNSPNNMAEDSVELVFKSGRNQMDETTGKVADEFYAVEKEPRGIRTGPDDYDIEFDGENFVRSVDDLQSDTSKLKEVATGKKQTLGEFVNSKKKKDKVKQINEDQVEQAEYLEQKYGPGPEDADDFASGGLAGMLGQ